MAAPAGRKNERSFLLGGASLSNNPERNVGDISSNTSTPSPPTRRSALTQLAQQRLGSMRWLMSRDVTISPPPPRAQGSPQQSRSVDPASGVYSAGDVRDRGPVRRSASAEADGVGGHPAAAGSRNSRLGGGLFSSGSGHKTRRSVRTDTKWLPLFPKARLLRRFPCLCSSRAALPLRTRLNGSQQCTRFHTNARGFLVNRRDHSLRKNDVAVRTGVQDTAVQTTLFLQVEQKSGTRGS